MWLVVVILAAAPILPLLYASLRSQPYYLPGGTWTLSAYTSLLTGAFVALAVIIPVPGRGLMSSVSALTTLVAPWHLWTASNWSQVANEPALQRSIYDSLLIAAAGGAATVAVAAVAAVLAHRSRYPLRGSLPLLMLYSRSVPGTILGIGFFWAFLMIGPVGSPLRTTIWGEMLEARRTIRSGMAAGARKPRA